MRTGERIQAHIVSIWREPRGFFSIGGKEGMLVLTNRNLMFVHKTTANMNWWKAITQRQVIGFIKSKDTMIHHDGYNEENLLDDMDDERNAEIPLEDIISIDHEEKSWGSVLNIEYETDDDDKKQKHRYSVAQDWVKYPAKEPTKYMKVDWKPFVRYVRERGVN